ncbi:MAG: hypothetical protein ACFFDT_08055, partial [Candidatus Hodarchaeota archaeon]
MVRPYIEEFIEYRKSVGTDGMHIFGLPGTGKTHQGMKILRDCLKNGEIGIMRGDIFTEWRHFLNFPDSIKKVLVLIPKRGKIHNIRVPNEVITDFRFVDFNTLNICDYLVPRQLTVCYDENYGLSEKAWFWVKTFKQIISRYQKEIVDIPVAYLDNEAGILWPETALSGTKESKETKNHWKAVHKFCELAVYFRKALVRPILISQLEQEIKWQLRMKCMWQVIRKGKAPRYAPAQVQRAAPLQSIEQYIVMLGGGLYCTGNTNYAFPETKEIWKMIPANELKLKIP